MEQRLGRRVLTAELQPSGFSLGTADRLFCEDGTRAFLKAVSAVAQPQTAQLHRAEINATQLLLPAELPTSSLIAAYDHDHWVALLLKNIDGKHPSTPWNEAEMVSAFKALDSIAQSEVEGVEQLEELTASMADELIFWQKIVEKPLTIESYRHLESDPNLARLQPHFAELNARASHYLEEIQTHLIPSLAGKHLVHTDLRADNILINADGEALIIDWPWACHGASFFDSASLLADVVAQGGTFTWDTVLAASETLAQTPRHLVELQLIAMCGYNLVAAQIPHQGDTNSSLPAFRLQRALTQSTWVLDNC